LTNKAPIRRLPGQSLAEDRRADLLQEVAPWVALPAFLWALFIFELLCCAWSAPPSPIGVGALALLGTAYSIYRARRVFRELESVGSGIRGERYVGQVLEDLCRPRGYRVLHDLPSHTGDFNIDHVLVGPEGVFAVETKHYSRPTQGQKAIVYDGNSVVVPGLALERDPLAQTLAAADYVRQVLRRTTGRDVFVRPVLIFAGWYVEQRAKRPKVWVVNENHLGAYLNHEDERLTPEDVALFADRLTMEAAKA
jgi:hypothetical protein